MSDNPFPVMLIAGLTTFSSLIVLKACDHPAFAHEAPKGWFYSTACCSNNDCREIPKSWVVESPKGYQMVKSGELITYQDQKIKRSKDDQYHWCTTSGSDHTSTICLYVPDRGF